LLIPDDLQARFDLLAVVKPLVRGALGGGMTEAEASVRLSAHLSANPPLCDLANGLLAEPTTNRSFDVRDAGVRLVVELVRPEADALLSTKDCALPTVG
jgi:hypothetical protein